MSSQSIVVAVVVVVGYGVSPSLVPYIQEPIPSHRTSTANKLFVDKLTDYPVVSVNYKETFNGSSLNYV